MKRIRWATKRVTGLTGHRKRDSIKRRFKRGASGQLEKKRESAGSDLADGSQTGESTTEESVDGNGGQGRQIFFNIPLPDDAKDEEGHPTANFGRNKIRTSKYTPLSFVPKNLWFQFHNIANVYFLILIILAVGRHRERLSCKFAANAILCSFSRCSALQIRA